jgi:hypothetical protein
MARLLTALDLAVPAVGVLKVLGFFVIETTHHILFQRPEL